MLEAVREYGYDGLELRLLDGEPIESSSSTSRLGAPSGRRSPAAVPLVCLDTSIELAQPFGRELPWPSSWRREWGAPAVRVFGGASDASG